MGSGSPAVSVVMATYNRSNIIGFSIESLLASTVTDWELLVIGDACTDDTAAMVARFADPRLRFVNLAENCGEQSGPNNAGVALARGRYLAFLNHDDLWLPDHLARSLAVLESDAGIDLVFGLALATARDDEPPRLVGATVLDGRYHPTLALVPASVWVMRRELMAHIGPMRAAREIVAPPTQDWIYRCWKSGAGLRASPHLAAVTIFSGSRTDSYRDRQQRAHEYWAARLRAPDFPVTELTQAALCWNDLGVRGRAWPFFREGLAILCRSLLRRAGIFPPMPLYRIRHGRRGSFLRALRKNRGLPPHQGV